jgi:hypothetical protein
MSIFAIRARSDEVTDIDQIANALEYRGFQIRVRIEPCSDWLTVTTDLIGFERAPVQGAGGTQLISGSITPRAARHAATAAAMAWIDAVLADGITEPS